MAKHLGNVTITIAGVPVEFVGVVFYPYVPATERDPADPPFAEYTGIRVGGIEVGEALINAQIDYWEDELINQLERGE